MATELSHCAKSRREECAPFVSTYLRTVANMLCDLQSRCTQHPREAARLSTWIGEASCVEALPTSQPFTYSCIARKTLLCCVAVE